MHTTLLFTLLSVFFLSFSTSDAGSKSFFGQDSVQNSEQSAVPQAAASPGPQAPARKKANKVWTNEDVGGLRGNVSVVGELPSQEKSNQDKKRNKLGNEPPEKSPEETRDAAWYRKQLAPLYAQLKSLDREVQKLKNFRGNNAAPEAGLRYGGRYNMTPLAEQLKQLESRKKSLQSNIEDIEREARRKGIEPGELR